MEEDKEIYQFEYLSYNFQDYIEIIEDLIVIKVPADLFHRFLSSLVHDLGFSQLLFLKLSEKKIYITNIKKRFVIELIFEDLKLEDIRQYFISYGDCLWLKPEELLKKSPSNPNRSEPPWPYENYRWIESKTVKDFYLYTDESNFERCGLLKNLDFEINKKVFSRNKNDLTYFSFLELERLIKFLHFMAQVPNPKLLKISQEIKWFKEEFFKEKNPIKNVLGTSLPPGFYVEMKRLVNNVKECMSDKCDISALPQVLDIDKNLHLAQRTKEKFPIVLLFLSPALAHPFIQERMKKVLFTLDSLMSNNSIPIIIDNEMVKTYESLFFTLEAVTLKEDVLFIDPFLEWFGVLNFLFKGEKFNDMDRLINLTHYLYAH